MPYFLRCPVGFAGETCENKVSPCESITCRNNGECRHLGPDKARCHCHPGYTGTQTHFTQSEYSRSFAFCIANRSPVVGKWCSLCAGRNSCTENVRVSCHVSLAGNFCERCELPDGQEHVCNVEAYGAFCHLEGEDNFFCNCPLGFHEVRLCVKGSNCRGQCKVRWDGLNRDG